MITVVSDLDSSPSPEELDQLNELKDLEDVFEFEEPRLGLKCEQDLDPVPFASLLNCCGGYFVRSIIASNSDLTDERLVVLCNLNNELLRSGSSIRSPFANLKFETSQPILSQSMLHL